MKKEEAQELEKQVEKSKFADVPEPKEQPLGFDFKPGGIVTLDRQSYLMLVNVLKPFQFLGSILDAAKDNAVRRGDILPFYEKDVKEVQKNEAGQIVNYILKDDFGLEKKDNAILLTDVNGKDLKSEKPAKSN